MQDMFCLLWSYQDLRWGFHSASCSDQRTPLSCCPCSSPLCPKLSARPSHGRRLWRYSKLQWLWRYLQTGRNSARSRGRQSELCQYEKCETGNCASRKHITMKTQLTTGKKRKNVTIHIGTKGNGSHFQAMESALNGCDWCWNALNEWKACK